MCDQGSDQASGPSADTGEKQPNYKRRNDAAPALVEVGDREQGSGAENSREDEAAGPVLEDALSEAPEDQFLANGDGDDHGEKRETFYRVLREYFQGELRNDALRFGGVRGEAPQADELICQNQRRQHDGNNRGQRRIWDGEAESGDRDLVCAGAPEDDGRGEPLKRDGGCIEHEAIAFGGLGHAGQVANAAPAEQRHGGGEKNQDEGKVPVHEVK